MALESHSLCSSLYLLILPPPLHCPSAGDQTRGPLHTRQALYQWNYTPILRHYLCASSKRAMELVGFGDVAGGQILNFGNEDLPRLFLMEEKKCVCVRARARPHAINIAQTTLHKGAPGGASSAQPLPTARGELIEP